MIIYVNLSIIYVNYHRIRKSCDNYTSIQRIAEKLNLGGINYVELPNEILSGMIFVLFSGSLRLR